MFVRKPHIQISAARKSQNVLYVSQWFRRLTAHASQAPLLQQALDNLIPYQHPWIGNAKFNSWAQRRYGSVWVFDPLVHHTSEMLHDMNRDDPTLANELQLLWAGDLKAGTTYASYRNRARELARICSETMDHEPGSIDAQIIERADDNDGFQILDMMKKATMLHSAIDTAEDFVDQDAELKKITHAFVTSGVHTYIASYRRQLQLFVEMRLPFELPEQYNCQRIITHLATKCQEFKKCSQEYSDAVRDKKITYTYSTVEARFTLCEKRHHLGPENHGTPIDGTTAIKPSTTPAFLAQVPPDMKKAAYPKGSCPIHPNSISHDAANCFVQKKRDKFVHPDSGKRGLSKAEICPKHPKGWHPADLCGDPRVFVPKRRKLTQNQYQQTHLANMVNLMQQQQHQMSQMMRNQVMMAAGGQQLMTAVGAQPVAMAGMQPQQQWTNPMLQLRQAPAMQWQSGIQPAMMTRPAIQPPPPAHVQQTSPAKQVTSTPRTLVYRGGGLQHLAATGHQRL